jgi:hypothetical protein
VRDARQRAGKIELVHAFKIEALIKAPALRGPFGTGKFVASAFPFGGLRKTELFCNGCDSTW